MAHLKIMKLLSDLFEVRRIMDELNCHEDAHIVELLELKYQKMYSDVLK
jgi:hypothetical protein